MKKIIILGFCPILFLIPFKTFAFQGLDLIISEIAWMGNESSYNNEWLEIYNNSSFETDLQGWKIISKNGKLNISLSGKIKPRSFFILERTDEQTLPQIQADLIYKGSLNNSGEYLILKDPQNNIIDEINCQSGWFAGNNETKTTMERKDFKSPGSNSDNWQNSINPGGSPGQKTQIFYDKNLDSNNQEKSSTTETIKVSESLKIFFKELLPSPEGEDSKNEWIKIYNEENEVINLSGWQIKDVLGKTKSYIFPENTIIKPKESLVFFSSSTGIMLNNDRDSLLLINAAGEIIDNVSFTKAPQGKTYLKTEEEWKWSPLKLKEAEGVKPSTAEQVNNSDNSIKISKKTQKTDPRLKNLAFSGQFSYNYNFSFLLLTALFFSLLAGILCVFLRKKIRADL